MQIARSKNAAHLYVIKYVSKLFRCEKLLEIVNDLMQGVFMDTSAHLSHESLEDFGLDCECSTFVAHWIVHVMSLGFSFHHNISHKMP